MTAQRPVCRVVTTQESRVRRGRDGHLRYLLSTPTLAQQEANINTSETVFSVMAINEDRTLILLECGVSVSIVTPPGGMGPGSEGWSSRQDVMQTFLQSWPGHPWVVVRKVAGLCSPQTITVFKQLCCEQWQKLKHTCDFSENYFYCRRFGCCDDCYYKVTASVVFMVI